MAALLDTRASTNTTRLLHMLKNDRVAVLYVARSLWLTTVS
jgi:hypothetical protein